MSSADFFKINFFKNSFQKYLMSVKQIGSRTGLTFCGARSGPICLQWLWAEDTSRPWVNPLLVSHDFFFRLLIIFANFLDPGQDQQNILISIQTIWQSDSVHKFFEYFFLEECVNTESLIWNLGSRAELTMIINLALYPPGITCHLLIFLG